MAEYIDKSAVVAKIDEFVEINKAHGFPVDIFDMEMLKKRIEQIPAADVAPVVHGKVIDMLGSLKVSEIQCPDCRRTIYVPIQLRFCERCGEILEVCDNG